MRDDHSSEKDSTETGAEATDAVCPACGGPVVQEKCKVVCRSERCVHRIVYNCSEF